MLHVGGRVHVGINTYYSFGYSVDVFLGLFHTGRGTSLVIFWHANPHNTLALRELRAVAVGVLLLLCRR